MIDSSILELPYDVRSFLVTVGHQTNFVVYASRTNGGNWSDLSQPLREPEWECIITTPSGTNIGRGATALACVENGVERHKECSGFRAQTTPKKISLEELDL